VKIIDHFVPCLGWIMKSKHLVIVLIGIVGASPSRCLFADTTNGAPTEAVQPLRVIVDPRTELLSVIFRLAGNPEYSIARVKSYTDDVENQFGKFRNEPVVKLAQEVRQTHGVSYDAVMSMAVHLTDTTNVGLRISLHPWPEGLDRRWTTGDANHFIKAMQQFVEDTSFREFTEQHAKLYQTTADRLQSLMKKEAHLEWFDAFFGGRPQASFTVDIDLLNGGGNYGPHFRALDGREELYCILGVWRTDSQGLPEFGSDALPVIIHEFCHSYCNPVIDRHLSELRSSGDALFAHESERMRSQAYGDGPTLLRESLVRACVIRYLHRYGGEAAARRNIEAEEQNGFLWIEELSDLLGDYEANRGRYPTLDDFSPRLAEFFAQSAKHVAQMRPSVIGIGTQLSQTNAAVTVMSVFPDSPAWKAGIKPGFTIISIDHTTTVNLSAWECANLIRGDLDTEVTLGVLDPTRHQTNTLTLKRVRIYYDLPSKR
jgi:hypothetical protein